MTRTDRFHALAWGVIAAVLTALVLVVGGGFHDPAAPELTPRERAESLTCGEGMTANRTLTGCTTLTVYEDGSWATGDGMTGCLPEGLCAED